MNYIPLLLGGMVSAYTIYEIHKCRKVHETLKSSYKIPSHLPDDVFLWRLKCQKATKDHMSASASDVCKLWLGLNKR
jgi:hypothetical protein